MSRHIIRRVMSGRAGGLVYDVTMHNFREKVLASPVPVLLDCYADWCGPCKQLTPVLKDAVEKSGLVNLGLLNTDKETELSDSLQIKSLPTVFGGGAEKSPVRSPVPNRGNTSTNS